MPPRNNLPDSLYVHVPFCAHICPYCDFPKVLYKESWAKSYIQALQNEAKARSAGLFSTLYVGGGTPSCLKEEDFFALLSFLAGHLKPSGEFSVECNPDSLTPEKAKILRECGVNRVSLGVQSSVPKSLKTLGRRHDFTKVKEAVALLREQGINNINLDWMYGFPGQSEEDLKQDIAAFLSLDVPHISAYSLILEQGTAYAVKGVEPLDDDTQQDYFDRIKEALCQAGYLRYEISNFAKPGYQCRHNLTYWHDEPYLALGLGAAGYLGTKRYRNPLSLGRYLNGDFAGEEEELTEKDALEEYFLTTLRLTEGFDIHGFIDRFGLDIYQAHRRRFEAVIARGLMQEEQGRLMATERGLDLLDTLLLALFE